MTDIAYEHWIYIDREFLETSYENSTGKGLLTEKTHTKEVGGNASIGVVSGGVAGSTSESFSVSKIKLTDDLYGYLMGYSAFIDSHGTITKNTAICTIEGVLYPTVVSTKKNSGKEIIHGEYTELRVASDGYDLALMPKEECFVSGMGALLQAKPNKPEDLALPVKALLRVFPLTESNEEWVAIPLLIHEKT